VGKKWDRVFFRTIRVRDGRIADSAYEEPFASLLGSHKGSMVQLAGRCVNRYLSSKHSGALRAAKPDSDDLTTVHQGVGPA
jgi:hypothetical protein